MHREDLFDVEPLQLSKYLSLVLWCRVNQDSAGEEKIALFRSLFRGREDIYPQRFECSKTGRAGYLPACGIEWVRRIYEKPRIKCSERPHQRFLPVTHDMVRWRLSGRHDQDRGFGMGLYPIPLE